VPYHHGDLRVAFLAAAVDVIGEKGPGLMSLREVARRAGVSHTAATHHFGDKTGLLTALATEGFALLDSALAETASLSEIGVAYVGFAVSHPAHFSVMFRPELLRVDDPSFQAAELAAAQHVFAGRSIDDAVAAWSIVHGFATLWLQRALPPALGDDAVEIARRIAARLNVQ
jgi:AcrR family transcriptional regulator